MSLPITQYEPVIDQGSLGVSPDADYLEGQFSQIRQDALILATNKINDSTLQKGFLEIIDKASEPDWDGYGALSMDYGSLRFALAFLWLLPNHYPLPEIDMDNKGRISLEWFSTKSKRLSVSVTGTGKLIYAFLAGANSGSGEEYIGSNVPNTILGIIRRITG